MHNEQEHQQSTRDGSMPLHISSHRSHVSNANHETSQLTVENVTKLEQEYTSADGNLPEMKTVEEYIRNQLSWSKGQQNIKTPSGTTTGPEGRSLESEAKPDILYRHREAVPSGNGNETDAQENKSTESGTQLCSSVHKKGYVLDEDHVNTKNIQTQTEWRWHDMSSSNFIADEHPERKDTAVLTSAAAGAEISLVIQEFVLDKSSHTKYEGKHCDSEQSCTFEDRPLPPMESQALCVFCHEAKKPFPTPEQLSSEPVHTLFCCKNYQTLFQYFIMGVIESNACDETVDPFNINPDPHFGEGHDAVENLKKDEVTIAIKPHLYFDEDQEAFEDLKKEFSKSNTKTYITSVANHLKVFGSLLAMNTISFSLTAKDNKITENAEIDNLYSGNAFLLDDLFISIQGLPNPLLKTERKVSIEHYDTGKNFSILFPDGTGQFFYPSGNIGILIICSNPFQFTFIILEDVQQNPQIQAVFMSNGHSACYHPNGMLWTVLDPLGGSYFEENGMQKKRWTWWDFSQHVHAPPFQSISLKLSSNTDVCLLAQDQIHVTFSSKKNVTFNVGSKLLLKDPGNAILLKKAMGSKEGSYLRLKKCQICSLLDHISKSVRIATDLPNRTDILEYCVSQLTKSLTYMRQLASRYQNALLFHMNFSKGLHGESAGIKEPNLKKRHRQRLSQQTSGQSTRCTSLTQAKSHKDTKETANKDSGKKKASKMMEQMTQMQKPKNVKFL